MRLTREAGRKGAEAAREAVAAHDVWWRRTAKKMAVRWAADERRGAQPGKRQHALGLGRDTIHT
jgi:hypothetical protein